MGVGICNIVLDTADPVKLAQFWAAALHWKIADWSGPEEAAVQNPAGGTQLYFMRVPDPKTVKNRIHLDLEPDGSAGVEIERLIGLGARKEREYESHTVMTDPDGNEFCVTGLATS